MITREPFTENEKYFKSKIKIIVFYLGARRKSHYIPGLW